jgi:crotonobetainyl-CoA:carnitine CoA-transferase CaiB-like acyl-CoA transferase
LNTPSAPSGNEISFPLGAAIARPTNDRLYRKPDALGIDFGPVRLLYPVLIEPQMPTQAMCVEVNEPRILVRQPQILDENAISITCKAPTFGEHTAEVLITIEAAAIS